MNWQNSGSTIPFSGDDGLSFDLNLCILAKQSLDPYQRAGRWVVLINEAVSDGAQGKQLFMIETNNVIVKFDQVLGRSSSRR